MHTLSKDDFYNVHMLDSRQEFIMQLAEFLENRGVPNVVVGRCRDLQSMNQHDVDFIVNDKHIKNVHGAISGIAKCNNILLVQRIKHESNGVYYVLWSADNGVFTLVDFCGNYIVNAMQYLRATYLLDNRERSFLSLGSFNLKHAMPKREFIYYFFKKIRKGELSSTQVQHLGAMWSKDPQGTQLELMQFFSPQIVQCIRDAVETENWVYVRNRLPELRVAVYRKLRRWSPTLLLRELFRKQERLIRPTGLHVVFLGPDGSGKTSVMGRVLDEIAPAFRRTRAMHLRPGLLLQQDGDPITDPHSQAPRGLILSIVKIAYWLGDYVVGWWIKVRPMLARSTLVGFDRYYHDLLVDPRRYRYGGPMWLARLAGRLIPLPDLWIILDAPAEVFQARKQEVPPAETARQRDAYRALAGKLSNAVVVDASQPLDSVVTNASRAILTFMAERTRRRYGP